MGNGPIGCVTCSGVQNGSSDVKVAKASQGSALRCSNNPLMACGPHCGTSMNCGCQTGPGSRFFDDDAMLLERLVAADHGDHLLMKLHVNAALFANTASEIVEGLLRLTRQQPVLRGEEALCQEFHEGLEFYAQPPVGLLKTLQWVYRAEELPEAASQPARHCVLSFFSTMLAAAAALKWQGRPPASWRRRGIGPVEVFKGAEAKLPEVAAGLRFLACIALLQHCAESSLLGNTQLVHALLQKTGANRTAQSTNSTDMNSKLLTDQPPTNDGVLADSAGTEALAAAGRRPRPTNKGPLADGAWTSFFQEARQRPADATVSLLRDLHPMEADGGVHISKRLGPSRSMQPQAPAIVRNTWDDEVVPCGVSWVNEADPGSTSKQRCSSRPSAFEEQQQPEPDVYKTQRIITTV